MSTEIKRPTPPARSTQEVADKRRALQFKYELSVEGKLLDPVKTSSDQKELVAVNQLKLHVNLMLVHPAIEDELILSRAPKGEVRRPVLVVPLREGESCVRETYGSPVIGERI